jgi:hypothetical protein
MSGGRYTKKIPEKIYFIGEDDRWIQGPYVNVPRGSREGDENLRTFELKEKFTESKRELWKDFCIRKGYKPKEEDLKENKENAIATFIFFYSAYVTEQKLNWRRAIINIKKIIKGKMLINDEL